MTKYAREPFAYTLKDGTNHVVMDGVAYNDDDPVVKKWPDRFYEPKEQPIPPR